jgi:hypothetical protein
MSEVLFVGITDSDDPLEQDDPRLYGGLFSREGGYPGCAIDTTAAILISLFKVISDPKVRSEGIKAIAQKAVELASMDGSADPVKTAEDIDQVGIGMGLYDTAIGIRDLEKIKIFGCDFKEALSDDKPGVADTKELWAKIGPTVRNDEGYLTPYEFATIYETCYGNKEFDFSLLKQHGRWIRDDDDENEELEDPTLKLFDPSSVRIPQGVSNTKFSIQEKTPVNGHRILFRLKSVEIDGTNVTLAPAELRTFEYLYEHRNSFVTENDLAIGIGCKCIEGKRSPVAVYISAIRKKIVTPYPFVHIIAKYGTGYLLRLD